MLAQIVLVALVGALGVSANTVSTLLTRSPHSPVLARQITPSQIPSACQSQCTSALTIYSACTSGDTNTCLSVCQSSNYASFTGCLQCVLNNTPGVSSAEVGALNQIIGQLATACQAAGSPVSATSFAAGSGTATASRSGASASVSSVLSSVTSRASTTTSAPTGSATGVVSSVSGALSSVVSAASSRAAGQAVAVLPQGIGAVVYGLVGMGAGAALIL